MTAVAPKHAPRALLGAILLLVLAASVYAASRPPAIEVVGSPLARSAVPGATAKFDIVVKRKNGFDRRIAIYVRGLPAGSKVLWQSSSGSTLPRAYTRGPTVIVPARRKTAILTVRLPRSARQGTYRPLLRAYGRRVRDVARLRLEVRPRSVVTPAPAPGFTVSAQTGRTLLQGDEASWDIALERRGGLADPIAMGVAGLPPGARASWSEGGLVSGDRVTLTVRTERDTPTGSYELTITGTAAGATESAVALLDVLETKPFGIAGGATASLRPGISVPLDLELTNPYDFSLRVEQIVARVADETSSPGCSGTGNYRVEQGPGAFPLVLAPGTTRLAEIVPAAALPRLEMRETGTGQDACRGATVRLRYEGVAGR